MKWLLMLGAAIAVASAGTIAIADASSATPARVDRQAAAPAIQEPFTAMPCPKEPVSTPELEGCIEHELLATDKRIDQLDEEFSASLGDAGLRRKFVAGHRAWLSYRRTDCADLWAVTEEGTINPIVVGNCEVARNRQRIADLREVIAFPEKP